MITSQENKRAGLFVLAATAFLRGAHNSVYNVIWQPFVLSLGVSMSTLGVMNSLGGMNGIITTLAQPVGGWLADRIGRKPFLLASSVFIAIGYTIFAIAGWLNLWTALLFGLIFWGASALAIPARNSMTAESSRASQLGSAFSLICSRRLCLGSSRRQLADGLQIALVMSAFFRLASRSK